MELATAEASGLPSPTGHDLPFSLTLHPIHPPSCCLCAISELSDDAQNQTEKLQSWQDSYEGSPFQDQSAESSASSLPAGFAYTPSQTETCLHSVEEITCSINFGDSPSTLSSTSDHSYGEFPLSEPNSLSSKEGSDSLPDPCLDNSQQNLEEAPSASSEPSQELSSSPNQSLDLQESVRIQHEDNAPSSSSDSLLDGELQPISGDDKTEADSFKVASIQSCESSSESADNDATVSERGERDGQVDFSSTRDINLDLKTSEESLVPESNQDAREADPENSSFPHLNDEESSKEAKTPTISEKQQLELRSEGDLGNATEQPFAKLCTSVDKENNDESMEHSIPLDSTIDVNIKEKIERNVDISVVLNNCVDSLSVDLSAVDDKSALVSEDLLSDIPFIEDSCDEVDFIVESPSTNESAETNEDDARNLKMVAGDCLQGDLENAHIVLNPQPDLSIPEDDITQDRPLLTEAIVLEEDNEITNKTDKCDDTNDKNRDTETSGPNISLKNQSVRDETSSVPTVDSIEDGYPNDPPLSPITLDKEQDQSAFDNALESMSDSYQTCAASQLHDTSDRNLGSICDKGEEFHKEQRESSSTVDEVYSIGATFCNDAQGSKTDEDSGEPIIQTESDLAKDANCKSVIDENYEDVQIIFALSQTVLSENMENEQPPDHETSHIESYLLKTDSINGDSLCNSDKGKDTDETSKPIRHRMENDELNQNNNDTSLASSLAELTAFSTDFQISPSFEDDTNSEPNSDAKDAEICLTKDDLGSDRNILESISNFKETVSEESDYNGKEVRLNPNESLTQMTNSCSYTDSIESDNLDKEITESFSDSTNEPSKETLFSTFLPTITEEREDLSIISVRSVSESNVSSISSRHHDAEGAPDTPPSNKRLRPSVSNPEFFFSADKAHCSVQGDADRGYQLVVGDVVRNIPDIVLLMEDKAGMGLVEPPVESERTEYFGTQEIVMMNDDESFVTVVQDSYDENALEQEDDSSSDREEPEHNFENLVEDGFRMERLVERRASEGMYRDLLVHGNRFPSDGLTSKKNLTKDKKLRRLSMIIGRGLSKFMKGDEENKRRSKPLDRCGSSESLYSKGSFQESETDEGITSISEVSGVTSVSTNSSKWRTVSGTKRKLASSRRRMLKSEHTPPYSAGGDGENGNSCSALQGELLKHRRHSFGKRNQGGGRRPNECLILEPSGTIAIDYPNVELIHPGQRPSVSPRTLNNFLALEHSDIPLKGARGSCPHNSSSPPPPIPTHTHPLSNDVSSHHHHYGGVGTTTTTTTTTTHHPLHHHHHHHPHHHQHDPCLPDLLRGGRSRGSVGSSVRDGSDTSSAYSGSDTMCQSLHSLDHEDVDLSGLMESVVDSDEEDLAESVESLSVRDAVRECLEKDPSERTEDDVKVLLEFTERLSAFSNMTVAVRRAMCQSMVFAVVDEAGTILMQDKEELDSWSVIINGHVEVTCPDGTIEELHLGDSFGITPTMEKLYHIGVMRSKVPDCQFVCIRQSDYYRILHQGEENTKRIEEDGVLVLVTEQRHIEACDRKGHIVIKGTPERLMQQLVEVANELDPTYVEDFLLTHRTFIENPLILANKLLEWFKDPKHQDHVTRVILRWVQSHFTDFEMDPYMMNFLEDFEEGLERKNMTGQLLLLRVACMTKARNRLVTLTRPSRDDPLQFKIIGDKDGIFISTVEKGSKAEEVGLKRADQILEVNSQSFDKITKAKALEVLTSTCHLAITVKSNLHAFNEMLKEPEHSHRSKNWMTSEVTGNGACHGAADFMSTLNLNSNPQIQNNKKEEKLMSMTLKAHKLKERFLATIGNKASIVDTPSDDSVSSHSSLGGPLYRSRSNPDLSTSGYDDSSRSEFPDHVLKVYRATDHSTRFIPVHKETTAREVVMLSLPLFNITAEPSHNYALFEVSVTEQGVVKQKRLSPDLKNLAERIGLSSRYYLRSVASSQNLCPDEVISELIRESQVNILQLNSVELAIQLTLEDFTVFRQIEPTEYVDNLFKLKSRYGTPALSNFEDISNKELYWVCTEVCNEQNLVKRAKIIKQFIKIAKHCKDVKNFNSMFAILSGLGSGCISRLRQTWTRVSNRYRRMFSELESFMDPSRNMSKYRNLINCESSQSPMIPFFPIAKKDLTFHNEGNDDKVDGLINFEKLRTISRSIRELGHMCSARYDPNKMLEQLGQPLNSAMTAMNQGITGGSQISTVKRRKKSTAQPDKKKMFEEAQMVRRVKAYLAQLNVIRDENELLKASYECEPPASGTSSTTTHTILSTNSSSSSSGQVSSTGSNSAPPTNPQTRKRPNSPTPSTASSASSTSHTSDGKKPHARFGAASPTSERKMMALAESTKKPYHGPRPPTAAATALTHASLSPNPSPGALRRGPAAPVLTMNVSCPANARGNHERSHSDTPVSSVDLSAESSSVTSLSSFANLRKSLTSGSVTSQDCHGSQGETDSGISTQFDCHSSSSLEVELNASIPYDGHYQSSPHNPQRRFSHQPEATYRLAPPHAIPVLPPIVPEVCNVRLARRGTGGVPPDYNSTQMRFQQMGRALSHDGVHYYHYTRHEEDDDEGRVSAV